MVLGAEAGFKDPNMQEQDLMSYIEVEYASLDKEIEKQEAMLKLIVDQLKKQEGASKPKQSDSEFQVSLKPKKSKKAVE